MILQFASSVYHTQSRTDYLLGLAAVKSFTVRTCKALWRGSPDEDKFSDSSFAQTHVVVMTYK
jgi:hypothetical protein